MVRRGRKCRRRRRTPREMTKRERVKKATEPPLLGESSIMAEAWMMRREEKIST